MDAPNAVAVTLKVSDTRGFDMESGGSETSN
jgi:hypothetical protein